MAEHPDRIIQQQAASIMAERYPKDTTRGKTQSKSNRTSDTASKRSIRTSRSSRSSVGVAAARARATFAEKEIAIKVGKARLEANLEALHLAKEAAAASAEAEIVEVAAEFEDEELYDRKSHSSSARSTEKRVCDYIKDQATYFSDQADLAPDQALDCNLNLTK